MKKAIERIAFLVFTVIFIGGCGSKELASGFNEDDIKEKSEKIIKMIDSEKYMEICNDEASEELKETITVDVIKEMVEQAAPDRGKFKKFVAEEVVGEKNKEINENCAVSTVVVKYKNQRVTYTIAFNQDMKIEGLYMK